MTTKDILLRPGPGVPGDCYPGLPPVRRARGYRLYTDGGRFLDFWQAGGGAFLGHSPSGLGKALKAEIDRGLFATVATHRPKGLEQALGALLAGWTFTPYADLSRALAAVSRISGEAPSSVGDPGCALSPHGAGIALWRPLIDGTPSIEGYLLPILPGMHATTAVLLGVPNPADQAPDYRPPGPGDRLSPIDLTLLTHGALLLARALDATGKPPANEISLRDAGAKDSLAAIWDLRGPYLTPRCAKSDYDQMFDIYFKNGFYIAPRYPGPSILPAHCSQGEWGRFLEVTQRIAKALPA